MSSFLAAQHKRYQTMSLDKVEDVFDFLRNTEPESIKEELKNELPKYKHLEGKYSNFWQATITNVFVGIDEKEYARMEWEHQFAQGLAIPQHQNDTFRIWAKLNNNKYVDAKSTAASGILQEQSPEK